MQDIFIMAVEEKMQQDGLTRKELAEKCGFPEVTIDRVLGKNISLTLDIAVCIAVALGLSLDGVCGILANR